MIPYVTPEIILGPPGTGKTTTLLGMVDEELAQGVAPDRIGYVSFTKRAAQEAIERSCQKFGLEREDLRYFRTLHSMCFNALGLSNGDVFEGKKLLEFGDWIGVELSRRATSDDGLLTAFTQGDRALFMENLARVQCISLREQYERDHDNLNWRFVERVGWALEQYKKDHQLVDYTDMLDRFARSEWSPRLEVLFVDEAQDLSMLQWRVVQKLAQGCRRVVIAGDDDQAIYRWAGAAVEHFVDMVGDVRVLGQSWRCPPEVQAVSQDLISRVQHRRDKPWRPHEESGRVDRVQTFDEVDTSGSSIMVLGRNAFVLRSVAAELHSRGVIYELNGHSSVSQRLLQGVTLWERLRRGESVTAEEARAVYALMATGTGVRRGYKTLAGVAPDMMVNMQWLRESGGLVRDDIWHEALERIPPDELQYMLRARKSGESLQPGRARVRLSTIHGSKGGEADHVVLMRDVARRTFDEVRVAPEDEARVWYVAVTRARRQLTIVAPSTSMSYDV